MKRTYLIITLILATISFLSASEPIKSPLDTIFNDLDIYFVTNLEPNHIATDVTFRVTGKTPQRWNAITGVTGETVSNYRIDKNGTTIPLEFEPWESAFFIFTPGVTTPGILKTSAELPEPVVINREWKMKLEGYDFEPYNSSIKKLASWTDSPNTTQFSGTGSYEIEFDLSAGQLKNKGKLILQFVSGVQLPKMTCRKPICLLQA